MSLRHHEGLTQALSPFSEPRTSKTKIDNLEKQTLIGIVGSEFEAKNQKNINPVLSLLLVIFPAVNSKTKP